MKFTITIDIPDSEALRIAREIGASIGKVAKDTPSYLPEESGFWTREEYAKEFNLSKEAVSKLCHADKLKYVQNGRRGRILIYKNQMKVA